ncbi:MAG: anti-sigma factor (TIGR02949 family) [Verrucomicrobiales bacterium]|jgi:anti-sigma factor (TIGR02949 family)
MAQKTINCRDVALRLQTYLDGELDHELMERIRAHLDACVDCGLEVDVFTSIKNDLAAQRIPADSEALSRLREFSTRVANEGR